MEDGFESVRFLRATSVSCFNDVVYLCDMWSAVAKKSSCLEEILWVKREAKKMSASTGFWLVGPHDLQLIKIMPTFNSESVSDTLMLHICNKKSIAEP